MVRSVSGITSAISGSPTTRSTKPSVVCSVWDLPCVTRTPPTLFSPISTMRVWAEAGASAAATRSAEPASGAATASASAP